MARKVEGKPILCHLCGAGGGTLVKDEKGYRHQKPERMCQRREVRPDEPEGAK